MSTIIRASTIGAPRSMICLDCSFAPAAMSLFRRPLINPRDLQISAFVDTSPRGFGLMQRQRAFVDYQDLESRYEKRASAWIEPIGDWGQGVVELVEIPNDREINDNIVAFWRPHDPLRAKGEYLLSYRLHWCWAAPGQVTLAQVMQTRCGRSWDQKHRQFVVDFVGDILKSLKPDKPTYLSRSVAIRARSSAPSHSSIPTSVNGASASNSMSRTLGW